MKTPNVKKKTTDAKDLSVDELKRAGAMLTDIIRKAEKKYKNMDSRTQKKLLTGIVGATTLIAGAIGLKKMQDKKKDKK